MITNLIPKTISQEIIKDFIANYYMKLLITNNIYVEQFEGNFIKLSKDGFEIHDKFGIMTTYNEMDEEQLDLVARFVPIFKEKLK